MQRFIQGSDRAQGKIDNRFLLSTYAPLWMLFLHGLGRIRKYDLMRQQCLLRQIATPAQQALNEFEKAEIVHRN